jgi:hypothetical protein
VAREYYVVPLYDGHVAGKYIDLFEARAFDCQLGECVVHNPVFSFFKNILKSVRLFFT